MPICKKEQMSNWETRPLRQSQQHYAALDAYILVRLINKLHEKGSEDGHPIENFIITLDKRNYHPHDGDDDVNEDGTINRPAVSGAYNGGKQKSYARPDGG
jgi:hypothetical protein